MLADSRQVNNYKNSHSRKHTMAFAIQVFEGRNDDDGDRLRLLSQLAHRNSPKHIQAFPDVRLKPQTFYRIL